MSHFSDKGWPFVTFKVAKDLQPYYEPVIPPNGLLPEVSIDDNAGEDDSEHGWSIIRKYDPPRSTYYIENAYNGNLYGPYLDMKPHLMTVQGAVLMSYPDKTLVTRILLPLLQVVKQQPDLNQRIEQQDNKLLDTGRASREPILVLSPLSLQMPRIYDTLRSSRIRGLSRWQINASVPPSEALEYTAAKLFNDYSWIGDTRDTMWCVEIEWLYETYWQARLCLRGIFRWNPTSKQLNLLWTPAPSRSTCFVWHPSLYLALVRAQPWSSLAYPLENKEPSERQWLSPLVDGYYNSYLLGDAFSAFFDGQKQAAAKAQQERNEQLLQILGTSTMNENLELHRAAQTIRDHLNALVGQYDALKTTRHQLLEKYNKEEKPNIDTLVAEWLYGDRDLTENILEFISDLLTALYPHEDPNNIAETMEDLGIIADEMDSDRESLIRALKIILTQHDAVSGKVEEQVNPRIKELEERLQLQLNQINEMELSKQAYVLTVKSLELQLKTLLATRVENTGSSSRLTQAMADLSDAKKREKQLIEEMKQEKNKVAALLAEIQVMKEMIHASRVQDEKRKIEQSSLLSELESKYKRELEDEKKRSEEQLLDEKKRVDTKVKLLLDKLKVMREDIKKAQKQADEKLEAEVINEKKKGDDRVETEKKLGEQQVDLVRQDVTRLERLLEEAQKTALAASNDKEKTQQETKLQMLQLESRLTEIAKLSKEEVDSSNAMIVKLKQGSDQLREYYNEMRKKYEMEKVEHAKTEQLARTRLDRIAEKVKELSQLSDELSSCKKKGKEMDAQIKRLEEEMQANRIKLQGAVLQNQKLESRLKKLHASYVEWADAALLPRTMAALKIDPRLATTASLHPPYTPPVSPNLALIRAANGRPNDSASLETIGMNHVVDFVRFVEWRATDLPYDWKNDVSNGQYIRNVLFNPNRLLCTLHVFPQSGLPVYRLRNNDNSRPIMDDAVFTSINAVRTGQKDIDWQDPAHSSLHWKVLDKRTGARPVVAAWVSERGEVVLPEAHFLCSNAERLPVSEPILPRNGILVISDLSPYGKGGTLVYHAEAGYRNDLSTFIGHLPQATVEITLQQVDSDGNRYRLRRILLEPHTMND